MKFKILQMALEVLGFVVNIFIYKIPPISLKIASKLNGLCYSILAKMAENASGEVNPHV